MENQGEYPYERKIETWYTVDDFHINDEKIAGKAYELSLKNLENFDNPESFRKLIKNLL